MNKKFLDFVAVVIAYTSIPQISLAADQQVVFLAATLVASAGRDLNIVAGVVSNAGNGATSLSAGNNLNLKTVQTAEQNNITWDAKNHLNSGNTQELGSQVNGGGNVKLSSGNDLNARAANVQAKEALSVKAANNVNIEAGLSLIHI